MIDRRTTGTLTAAIVATALAGCQTSDATPALTTTSVDDAPVVAQAVAYLHPTAGSEARGTVRFSVAGDKGVDVDAEVTGLKPGEHAFHVHEFGDCSAPDAASAGGHYPFLEANDEAEPGVITGNLGELQADSVGHARSSAVMPTLDLNGPRSVTGRAVVVHRRGNDLSATPGGDTGPRVACGVIGVAGGTPR